MNKEKISNRKLKSMETKKKIYDTAALLFRNEGFENVTVDTIVETAGISKGAFYVHYPSKNTLIAQLIADNVKNTDINYKLYLDGIPEGTSASHILISLAGNIADFIASNIGYDVMKILYEILLTKNVDGDAVISYNRDLYIMFNEVIKRGIQQGEFTSSIDSDTITTHCILAIRGLTYEWCIRYPDFDYKEHVLKHFEMLLDGIKVKN
ncbi:TetR/AcrR family transcriptional regulator [Alkaliphilus peptidifermentans]|uniref:Transcriptional regulator, TetR family n=1 Tax=Alkaliphilus peptidifermentans DSM 18978 TaxID=1120976 RepID=A0A1G5KV11_9FIRM|nr:TetR/AcrR family transcriptional regulator [Alkaliphilus peptidifermentans]SCZ03978.1 transcriptional regulator, TetR family [Alkaliphilus peptidifermentans DSM 18978]